MSYRPAAQDVPIGRNASSSSKSGDRPSATAIPGATAASHLVEASFRQAVSLFLKSLMRL